MTFLNGALLAGTLAFAVPLIIHLLNRSKFQRVDWGAMHLLEAVLRVNQRRLQIQQWILLLVRCAIPIVLALCLAIPVLTKWQALPSDTPSSLLVVIDDSGSMSLQTPEPDGTLWEQAVDGIERMVAALPAGSEASMLLCGGLPELRPEALSVDLQRVGGTLQLASPTAGPVDAAGVLAETTQTLASMGQARRDVVIVSDFQAADWERLSESQRGQFREQCAAFDLKPAVHLIPIGARPRPSVENVAVESFTAERAVICAGQTVRLRSVLRNATTQPKRGLRLRLEIDGQPAATTTASIAAGATAQVVLNQTFETAGSHVATLVLEDDDALASDNQQSLTIEVLATVDVLLVDGNPSNQPLQGETGFLSVALSPFAFGREPLADLVKTRVIDPGKLDDAALAGSRIVVLAGVRRLSETQAEALRAFVAAGNGLIVFAGERTDLDWYTAELATGADALLPVTFAARQGAPRSGRALDEDPAPRLAAQFFEHPSMALFNQTSTGRLAEARVFAWHRLEPIEQRTLNRVATLDNGDLLVAEGGYGDGSVMVVGTTAQPAWTDLPMQPSFVPLVQEWVQWMATRGFPPRNVPLGQPAIVNVSGTAAGDWTWTRPDGLQVKASSRRIGSRQSFVYEQTRLPGVYTLRGPAVEATKTGEADANREGDANKEASDATVVHVAVAGDASESRASRLDASELERLAEQLGGQVVASAEDYLKQDQTRRYGREIWRPLLLLLLGLMITEVFLQQRFTGVGR